MHVSIYVFIFLYVCVGSIHLDGCLFTYVYMCTCTAIKCRVLFLFFSSVQHKHTHTHADTYGRLHMYVIANTLVCICIPQNYVPLTCIH